MFEVVSSERGRRRPIHRNVALAASVAVHLGVLGGLLLLPAPEHRPVRHEQQAPITFLDVPAPRLPPAPASGPAANGEARATTSTGREPRASGHASMRRTETRVENRKNVVPARVMPSAPVPDHLPPVPPTLAGLAGGHGLVADSVETRELNRLAESSAQRASEAARQVPVEASALAELPKLANPRTMAGWWSDLYPARLLARGVEGRTVVRFIIEMDGRVSEVEVVSTTHPDFGEATVRGAWHMRFRPARLGGKPVRVRATMPVEWVIPSV